MFGLQVLGIQMVTVYYLVPWSYLIKEEVAAAVLTKDVRLGVEHVGGNL